MVHWATAAPEFKFWSCTISVYTTGVATISELAVGLAQEHSSAERYGSPSAYCTPLFLHTLVRNHFSLRTCLALGAARNFPDRHTRPLAAPTPKFNFLSSEACGHLRSKLRWILFWLRFFRLTQRAQRLLAERLRLWFHNHCQFTSRQNSDTVATWLSLLFNLLKWLTACIMAWGTRWIYDRLFQILFALVCPAVYSDNIFSLCYICNT